MIKPPLILVFDIGKTNKKRLLFDEQYQLVDEEIIQIPETKDEDGFPAEDLDLLTKWVSDSWEKCQRNNAYQIKAIQVSAYGASLVHLDHLGKPFTALTNYLKPYPESLSEKFSSLYDRDNQLGIQTASPLLKNLNSGMQLFYLKNERPEIYNRIRYALHFPQYISSIFSGHYASEITSLGCHTRLWNFQIQAYHSWVHQEAMTGFFPMIYPGSEAFIRRTDGIPVGIGLHDSSASMIPYIFGCREPFVLISTGTWSISLNAFNTLPLTREELNLDCLCYLSFKGDQVKASRLFAGHMLDEYLKKLATQYEKPDREFIQLKPDSDIIGKWMSKDVEVLEAACNQYAFDHWEEAYFAGMVRLVLAQKKSTDLVLAGTPVKQIFVDGGFSKNPVFMYLLARLYPDMKIFASQLAQASARGAAMAMHGHWNHGERPVVMTDVKHIII